MNSRRREYCESRSDYRRSQQKRRHARRRRTAFFTIVGKVTVVLMALVLITNVLFNAVSLAGRNIAVVNGRFYSMSDERVINAMQLAYTRPTVNIPEIDWLVYEEEEVFEASETSIQLEAAPVEEEEVIEEEVKQEEPTMEEVKAEPEVTQVSSNNSGYVYTEEDYEYLLMAIVGEAQCYSYQHQIYVGSVILNRLHSTKYFTYVHCIKDVVLADGQYTCFDDGNAYRTPTARNIQVAKDLIEGGSVLPSNVLFQSQHVQGDGIYCEMDGTYFCYKN